MSIYFELDAFMDDDNPEEGNGEETAIEDTAIPDDVEPMAPEA